VIETSSQDKAVTIGSANMMLTEQEAADLLGVSHPTIVKFLDEGRLPFVRLGRTERILLSDLLVLRDEHHRQRRQTLAEMTRDSQQMPGFGSGFVRTR